MEYQKLLQTLKSSTLINMELVVLNLEWLHQLNHALGSRLEMPFIQLRVPYYLRKLTLLGSILIKMPNLYPVRFHLSMEELHPVEVKQHQSIANRRLWLYKG